MTSTTRSTVVRLRRTTRRSAAAVAALAAMTSLAAAGSAQAAGPAPNFQMPFVCGQMWEATTYDDHGPDPDSIDLGMWDADDNNISSGEPVLASADGVVTSVQLNGKNENQVYLDHGPGASGRRAPASSSRATTAPAARSSRSTRAASITCTPTRPPAAPPASRASPTTAAAS